MWEGLLASAGDVVAEVGVGDQLADCHVGAADRGAGDDCDQGVDLGGGLHALHRLSDCLAQHDGYVCVVRWRVGKVSCSSESSCKAA